MFTSENGQIIQTPVDVPTFSGPTQVLFTLGGTALPRLSIDDLSVVEGNSGTVNAVFPVTLSAATTVPVTVSYATADGTAAAGSDYTAMGGTLTIPVGQTTATIIVPVLADTVVEPNETFTLNLSNPTGATISDSQGVGTIVNDDVTPPATNATHTTSADFGGCGPAMSGTMITWRGDGEVRLAGTVGDEYGTSTLDPSRWTVGTWTAGTFAGVVSNSIVSLSGVNGAYVRSTTALAVTTLEAVVQFSATPWEHVGWGSLDFAGNQYLLFSTYDNSNNLYARSNNGGTEQRTDLGAIPTGFHAYRIERASLDDASDQVTYYVDGVQRAQHVVPTLPALYVYQSHASFVTSPTLDIERVWVYPAYVGSGTFQSCRMDAGSVVTWWTASWSATVPASAALAVATRTSSDGTTWSEWSAPLTTSGTTIGSPAGRYLQYQLTLTGAAPDSSPVVDAVTMTWETGGPTLPTVSIGPATVVEGNSGTTNAEFPVTLSAARRCW